ncbi:DUF106 domain-containing protein [Halocalculus aciditolerans]|uniref:HtlB n=1 Tax=Halocalculus aciditolerans TaxID=1383812 RepID=A0A830F8P9_9EURY|nr:DUF106 domain-containing protein [Halocalculus aciditolerans]GGL50912.1 HtlB [Halocalculus aciditolerans]
MARTEAKVRELIEGDPGMEDAIEALLEHRGEDIEWRDVKGDLTSGQWGRLIEKGVLEESGDAFRLADPDDVEAAVGEDIEYQGDDADDDEGSGWTTWDKLAALVALGMFAGYSYHPVRDAVGSVLNVALGPIADVLPFYLVIMCLAVFTGFYSTLLQANLMDMDKMSDYQERMKDIQERQKAARERGDDEALDQIRDEQMDAMGDQMGMMKQQVRPMVWIMVITIPVFLWMYWKLLAPGHLADAQKLITLPFIGETNLTAGVLGPIQAWILWYFLCSMGFSQVIRKALNIQTNPT